MSSRSILKVYPFSYNWIKINEKEIIVENFYTKRKIYLEETFAYLWELIVEDSDYEKIKLRFLEKYSIKELDSAIKKLKNCGIIQIE